MSRIDDPASAVAASHCLTARKLDDRGVTRLHPRSCGWCAWPLPELAAMVDDFNDRAGYNPRHGTYGRHDVRAFVDQSRAEQIAQVTAAQSLEEPMHPVEPAPADAEVPEWLR